MALIFDSGMKAFPARPAEQSIFYPVLNEEYAIQIARDWNTKEPDGAGYVTSFMVPDAFSQKYERHVVGGTKHEEWWVPANELTALNAAIQGFILVEQGFFSKSFKGDISNLAGLKGKDGRDQFISLARHLDYSSFDVWCETYVNRKTLFMNYLYWDQLEPTELGVSAEQKEKLFKFIDQRWAASDIGFPLPARGSSSI